MSVPRPKPSAPAGSNIATYLALFGLLVVASGLLALAALVNIAIFGILLVVVAFVFMGVFHYLVWGWWLSSLPVDDEEDPPKPRPHASH